MHEPAYNTDVPDAKDSCGLSAERDIPTGLKVSPGIPRRPPCRILDLADRRIKPGDEVTRLYVQTWKLRLWALHYASPIEGDEVING